MPLLNANRLRNAPHTKFKTGFSVFVYDEVIATIVIASGAKQSIERSGNWFASSLRSSQ
jgi:hypothetical protein